MSRCLGCGGVVGIDCYNPKECEQISQSNYQYDQQQIYELQQRVELLEKELEKHGIAVPATPKLKSDSSGWDDLEEFLLNQEAKRKS